MARDPLRVLLGLRKTAVDSARAEVGERLAIEHAAAAQVIAAEAAIAREIEAASDLAADDRMVDTLGRWLPHGREAVRTAQTALRRAEMEVAQARAGLAAARAGMELVEKRIAQQDAEQQAITQRKEQAVLDEAGLRRRPEM